MSGIDDVVSGGWWPLRHHATVDAALRYVRMACLVRADSGDSRVGSLKFGRDQYGRIREVDGSAGDVQGGLLWEAASPVVPFSRGQLVQQSGAPPTRDFPSLGFAFPAVAQDPNAPGSGGGPGPSCTFPTSVSTSSGLAPVGLNLAGNALMGPGGTVVARLNGGSSGVPAGVPGGTQTRSTAPIPQTASSSGPPPRLPTSVQLLPIQDEKITPDKRYSMLTAACAPGVGAKGTMGVVLSAMHERRMEPIFFPSGAPLIAVNHAGDPATSTLVLDEKDDGTPDPDRYAPLHSAWRVVRLARACAPGLTTSANLRGQLAWQLGGGGCDGLAGYGLAYDASGGAAPSGSTKAPQDPNQQQIDAIKKRLAQIEQQIATAQNAGSSGAAAIGALINERNTLNRELDQLTSSGSGSGSGSQSKPTGAAGTSGVVGAFSWRMGGPFDAGGEGCQHPLGSTFDGESVFSGHLRTDAYFRGPFDGPLNFEATALSKVMSGPYQMAAHLVWNPTLSHPHPCGQKQGRWWWYAEAMDYTTDGGGGGDDDGGGEIIDGGDGGRTVTGGGSGGNILINDENNQTSVATSPGAPFRTVGANGVSFPTVSGATTGAPSRTVGPTGVVFPRGPLIETTVGTASTPKTTRWRATQLLGITPGTVFRPNNLTVGQKDFRTVPLTPISNDDVKTANLAPATLRLEAFAQRGAGQWVYGIDRNVSAFPGGTALAGGLWTGPADRDLANELSGQPYVKTPVMTSYHVYHPSVNVGKGDFKQDGTNTVDTFNPFATLTTGLLDAMPTLAEGQLYLATDVCELWMGC